MPIKVQADLPAKKILEDENIFVMDEQRAVTQDIRPQNYDGMIITGAPVEQMAFEEVRYWEELT